MKLHTSLDQFEGLHRAEAKARSTSKSLTIDRAALVALLMDHSALEAVGVKPTWQP
jgi:hypothetical protein